MKSKAKLWCIIVVGFVVICGLLIGAACWVSEAQKERAQEQSVTRLYASLEGFPEFGKMHTYGEFYLKTEDKAYLILKIGDAVLTGEQTETETKYYETPSEAEAVLEAVQAEIASRLAKRGEYTCEKVNGPWKLRVMPDSKWLVTCKREGYPQEEYITYIENGGEEQIGWVMYNDYDDVKLYVYLSSKVPVKNDTNYIFGWGELPKNLHTGVKFETGVYHNKNWDDPVLTYEGNVVPDEMAAIRITSAIFEGIRTAEQRDHAPQLVFYDEQDEVWIVCFWDKVDDFGNPIVGGDVNIAVRKADGKVLRIWLGE